MKTRTTPMRYAVVGPLAAIALTAVSMSACGGGDPSGGTSSAGDTINICTLLPSSQVAVVAGESVVQATPEQLDSFPDPNSFLCTYDLSDGRDFEVEVAITSSPDAFAANSRSLLGGGATPITSVPGIGDKAVASANGLAILTDKDNIVITGLPGQYSGDLAEDIKLARILISALG
jgi:hypothetical protein